MCVYICIILSRFTFAMPFIVDFVTNSHWIIIIITIDAIVQASFTNELYNISKL